MRLVRVVRMMSELRDSVWVLTTRSTRFAKVYIYIYMRVCVCVCVCVCICIYRARGANGTGGGDGGGRTGARLRWVAGGREGGRGQPGRPLDGNTGVRE